VAGKQHQKRISRANRELATFRCDLCGVNSFDEAGHNIHMKGKRHREKVEGPRKAAAEGETNGSETNGETAGQINYSPCQVGTSCTFVFFVYAFELFFYAVLKIWIRIN